MKPTLSLQVRERSNVHCKGLLEVESFLVPVLGMTL